MAKKFYLGVDQGTTGVAAILLDESWQLVSRGYCEIKQYYPQAGWVEHDVLNIWEAVQEAIQSAIRDAGLRSEDRIACMGIDHEGESVVLWNRKTGLPIYNAIVWQDRRTARRTDELKKTHGALIAKKTGLEPDAYFSATKIQWILENVEGAKELSARGDLLAGTMDTWLIWNMTGRRCHATDATTASRTMLFNLQQQEWDQDILDILQIDRKILPAINDSAAIYGYTDPDVFFGLTIPISGVLVDQQAALLGQACITPGATKATYGTGCFMLMNTGETPVFTQNGILTTVAWRLDKKMSYALDGGVYIAGAATQWLRDGLKAIRTAQETEAIAQGLRDNGGVYFVPAFTGLAAPHWDSYARGMIIGITGGTTQEHIVRATLESTAYQVKDVFDAMKKDTDFAINLLRCDGGSTKNRFLMQFQADLLGIPLEVPEIADTTALGAAYMAALGNGEFAHMSEVERYWKVAHRYEPRMSADEREALMFDWHRAVERARGWAMT